jgi:hypothetical protein
MKRYALLVGLAIVAGLALVNAIWPAPEQLLIDTSAPAANPAAPDAWPRNAASPAMALPNPDAPLVCIPVFIPSVQPPERQPIEEV